MERERQDTTAEERLSVVVSHREATAAKKTMACIVWNLGDFLPYFVLLVLTLLTLVVSSAADRRPKAIQQADVALKTKYLLNSARCSERRCFGQ